MNMILLWLISVSLTSLTAAESVVRCCRVHTFRSPVGYFCVGRHAKKPRWALWKSLCTPFLKKRERNDKMHAFKIRVTSVTFTCCIDRLYVEGLLGST